MKGKTHFTKDQAEQIIALIELKLKSDSSKQKNIRNKIREIGFYASDFGLRDGYNVADFKRVVTIVETASSVAPTAETKNTTGIEKKEFDIPDSTKTLLNFDNEILDELRLNGFTGFKTISEIVERNYADIPNVRGIYALLYHNIVPEFVEVGTGGHFKSKNPNASIEMLKESWVDNVSIIYIGKAGAENGSATLKSRLRQYFNFGQGKAVGHWGGRYVWQLKDCYNIVVCWKELPHGNPRQEEATLISEFVKQYDKRPFANLVG